MTEERDTPGSDGDEGAINFPAFVLSLAHTAAVHFGDVPDPVTGQQAEMNLPAAQQMIDILSLLEAKTRGNLTAEDFGPDERPADPDLPDLMRAAVAAVRSRSGE